MLLRQKMAMVNENFLEDALRAALAANRDALHEVQHGQSDYSVENYVNSLYLLTENLKTITELLLAIKRST